MLNSITKYIISNPIGQLFRMGGKTVVWKKVGELKPGMQIAITSLPCQGEGKGGVCFDEIVSIRPVGQEQVYDIEVEGTHNFVGNGILAHNTIITSGNVGIGTTNPGAALDVVGSIRTNTQFISTLAIGTAPLAVTSTTVNTNLNADLLDGLHSASFLQGNQTITLSSDVTGSGTTAITTTLATVNANVGSFGSSTAIPTFTVNGKGLITAASTAAVVAPAGTLSGTTLNATVTGSSLTSVGTLTSLTLGGALAMGTNTITSGLINGQTISSAANFTGTMNIVGNVGIGTTNPGQKLSVIGTIESTSGGFKFPDGTTQTTAATLADVIHSTQPSSRATMPDCSAWGYLNEYITIVVPSGQTRSYQLVLRGMHNDLGTLDQFVLATSSTTTPPTAVWLAPYYSQATSGQWGSFNVSRTITLSAGTYNYYLWVYSAPCGSGGTYVNASSDGRLYSDLYAIPLLNAGGSDLAEYYPTNDSTINNGDLVTATSEGIINISKTSKPYQKSTGIISTNPGVVLGATTDLNTKIVGLAGRVPLKTYVTDKPIKTGDSLSSSDLPGIAMKSEKAGFTVATALEDFNPAIRSCLPIPSINDTNWNDYHDMEYDGICYQLPDGKKIAKLMVQINNSWSDPDMMLTSTGDIFIAGQDENYTVNNNGSIIDRIALLSKAVIARLQAGIITTQQLFVEKELISPIAYIDQLNSRNITAVNATISGTLTANQIDSPEIESLNSRFQILDSNYATASAILADIQSKYSQYDSLSTADLSTQNATISASTSLDSRFNILYSKQVITDDLSVNNSLLTNSINSNTGDLYLQPTGTGAINLLAGLMTLSPDGQVTINGTLNLVATNPFEKLLTIYNESGELVSSIDASGSAQFKTLIADSLTIATSSAQSASGGNASIGTATIASGSAEIVISNSNITPTTLVYLTPLSNTFNQVIFVKSKTENQGFVVAIPTAIDTDIQFNYWLIKTK